MNISKNLLSLGLIAVISGTSTAQTYTATAGTNGTTDIQNNYSMSTGDGASVSVDVPLEFELPKKVAIAVRGSGGTLPSNNLFDNVVNVSSWYNYTGNSSELADLSPFDGTVWTNLNKNKVGAIGVIYSNNAISITVNASDFVHESDPNSIIKGWKDFWVYKNDSYTTRFVRMYDDNISSTSSFPYTTNIDDSVLASSLNKLGFAFLSHLYLDTIDPTDRAGKYISTATITVSTL